MKRAQRFFEIVAGLVIIGALALGAIAAFRALSSAGTPGALVRTPQGYPPPEATVPVPEATVSTGPTPIVILPGQTVVIPTLTPWPTAPLPPTPTRRPGPTATAIPLPQPAKDAAGFILYMVRGKSNDSATYYSLPVDAKGRSQSPATIINQAAPLGLMYPAPNGSRVLIVDKNWGGRSILYTDNGKVEPLFRENLDPLGLFLGWHPDNRHVLIRAQENYIDAGLWLVDVDSGEHVTLLAQYPSPNIESGAISPDGQEVVYSFQRDIFSPGELWMMDADGANSHLLFTSGTAITDISWSPDGKKIVFAGEEGLQLIDSDGSNLRTLSRKAVPNGDFRPVWSPDSRTIAVTVGEMANAGDWYTDDFNGANIYLVNVTTGEERLLLNDGSSGNIDPAWSPDGSQIAFASIRSGKGEISIVNVDGTNLQQLTRNGQFTRFPFWRTAQTPSQP
jgi:Tol biopolymer transport system component